MNNDIMVYGIHGSATFPVVDIKRPNLSRGLYWGNNVVDNYQKNVCP